MNVDLINRSSNIIGLPANKNINNINIDKDQRELHSATNNKNDQVSKCVISEEDKKYFESKYSLEKSDKNKEFELLKDLSDKGYIEESNIYQFNWVRCKIRELSDDSTGIVVGEVISKGPSLSELLLKSDENGQLNLNDFQISKFNDDSLKLYNRIAYLLKQIYN